MSFNPKVSIIIPVYNGSNYMKEAIDSSLAQTYQNSEVIVVNDGTTDNGRTDAIAKSYGDQIRYFLKTNGGVASALNYGIGRMEGEYFSWLSHDDVYYPHKLENQIRYLEDLNKTVILYSDYEYIDSKSKFLETNKIDHVSPDRFIYSILIGHPIHGCTALVPRQCFKDVGLFNEQLKTSQDYDLWFRMAKKYEFVHLQEVLIKSRIHTEQGTQAMISRVMAEANELYINCMNDLCQNNTQIVPGESNPVSIIKIGIHLRKKGFFRAADHAFALSAPKRKIWNVKHYALLLYDDFLRRKTKIGLSFSN
ncbi:MAG: glycosyl transferase [Desulfobacterium sp.]|nr:glycosyl transferase [Desulfobacterium sp.]